MRDPFRILAAALTVLVLATGSYAGPSAGPANAVPDAQDLMDDPDFQAARDALEAQPGFLGLVPSMDGSRVLHAAFEGDGPDSLPPLPAPDGWTLQVARDVELRPTALPVDGVPGPDELIEPQPAHHDPIPHPDPTEIDGIRPGALLLVGFQDHDESYICSASFVMEDAKADKTYLSTAGHCLLPPGKTTTEGSGSHVHDPADTFVWVCVTDCLYGGLLWSLNAFPTDFRFINGITYARADAPSSVGSDFGIIEVPSSLSSLVEPAMAVWSGPDGHSPIEGDGRVLLHFGNGVTAGSAMPTKARAAVSSDDGNIFDTFGAWGVIAGGDSGSAIAHSQIGVSGLEGWAGLGVITHCAAIISLTGAECLPIIIGTTVYRGIDMVDADANIDITIVDA